jgi:hypothetical protein
MSYRGWRGKQNLHSSKGWGGLTDWTGVGMKNRNWYTDSYSWKWLIVAMVVTFILAYCNKAEASPTLAEYNFSPEVVELHIIKNNGMNSHEVYTCRNVRTCYNLYLEKRMKDMSINCATKMYIKRSNGNIMRLKGVRR